MKNYINRSRIAGLTAFLICLINFTSCKDELYIDSDGVDRVDNLPVEIEVLLPDATRALNAKKEFIDGEFIHIEAIFNMDD